MNNCGHGIMGACKQCFELKLGQMEEQRDKALKRVKRLEQALIDIQGYSRMEKAEEFHSASCTSIFHRFVRRH